MEACTGATSAAIVYTSGTYYRSFAVVGAPDARRGKVVAYVVAELDVDLDALRDRCAASLASFKTPRAVHRVDALPRNAMGKLQKHLLVTPPA